MDLEYSQTHLDDFLKSQSKHSRIQQRAQSGALLNSFVTTVNKVKQLPKPAPVLSDEEDLNRSDELIDLEQVEASGSQRRRLDSSSDEEGF